MHTVEHQKRTAGRSALVVRTVRARTESVRFPSFFLQDLLAKTAHLARDTDCNGSRPPLYIYIWRTTAD
jgi:hypothetical protein